MKDDKFYTIENGEVIDLSKIISIEDLQGGLEFGFNIKVHDKEQPLKIQYSTYDFVREAMNGDSNCDVAKVVNEHLKIVREKLIEAWKNYQAGKSKFDVNDMLQVKILEKGYQHLADNAKELYGHHPNFPKEWGNAEYHKKLADKNGYTKMPIWKLCNCFGTVLYPGTEGYFENDIIFENKDIKPFNESEESNGKDNRENISILRTCRAEERCDWLFEREEKRITNTD